MPIDSFILDPMLSPYESMIKDVEAQGLDNEHVDEMKRLFERMKSLGQEHSDITAFTGICMQENLYGAISDQYSKALQAKASSNGESGGYDDGALLAQNINALEQAINEIRKSKEQALQLANHDPLQSLSNDAAFASRFAAQQGLNVDQATIETQQRDHLEKEIAEKPNAYNSVAEVEALDNSEDLIAPIQNLIDLGKQEGMTFPRFLRLQIERGLDKAMEGAVVARNGLEYGQQWAKASMLSPHHIEKSDEQLRIFDELASKQAFNVPNWKELQWATKDSDNRFDRPIAVWENITERWEQILGDITTWALAHCSFAEYIDPWKPLPPSERRPAIHFDKATLPGIIEQRLRLLNKYHGLNFDAIFAHDTFQWAIDHHSIGYSKEYIHFLRSEIFPQCKPHQVMDSDKIAKMESLHQDKKIGNPRSHWPATRVQSFYDSKFGAGRYESKFGSIIPSDSTAEPW